MNRAFEPTSNSQEQDSSPVAVTGATGFIGTALLSELLSHGYRVHAITRQNPPAFNLSHNHLTWHQADLTDKDSMRNAISGCNAVCHCAGIISFARKDLPRLHHVNVEGTKTLIEACHKEDVKKFLLVSAAATIGCSKESNRSLNEEYMFEPHPSQTYAYTKKLAEDLVRRASGNGMDTVIVNPCTVYGPGDHSMNSGAIIRDVLQGRLRIAPPGGTTVVAVEDVAQGIRLALERGQNGERYLLANERMEFVDLLSTIADLVGVKPVRRKIPRLLYYPGMAAASILEGVLSSRVSREMISSLFQYKYYDASKAREELGWAPRVPFPEAVQRALEYYRENDLL